MTQASYPTLSRALRRVPPCASRVEAGGAVMLGSAGESGIHPLVPQIRLYQNWLREQHGLTFDS